MKKQLEKSERAMIRPYIFMLFFMLFFFMEISSAQELSPGDGVRITFYNISDQISGDYFVQQDGNIQLPYIGIVEVGRKSFETIRLEITTKYDSLYKQPELTVQPLFKIRILGEVRNSGLYFVTGVEKLTDILAMAGGQTEDANLNKIYFIRDNKKININAKKVLEKGRNIADLGLRSGDQIFVPKRWLNIRKASVILSGVAVAATIASIVISQSNSK